MRKKALFVLMSIMMVMGLACGCGKEEKKETQQTEKTSEKATEEEKKDATSEVALNKQGNPLEVALVDIVEEDTDDWKAWIKISTLYDPELSMYSSDLIPQNTQAIVVTFTVSNMDCEAQEMYWCYQLGAVGETVAVWDNTSPADKLMVDGDGTYTFVFDANKALGAPIDTVESFQMVFPGLTETTTTTVKVKSAVAITNASDVANYTSNKVE